MSQNSGHTVVVLQPGYLPWLGFFDQMRRSDTFVYYDDVQFDKHGWRNRNRIKSPTGPHWLTVPVHREGMEQQIREVEIDNRFPWARKHIGTIGQFYARAPYLDRYLPELEALLQRRWECIVDLDVALVEMISNWLGLRPSTVRSSELGIKGEKSQRLLDICRHFGASRYLTGDAAHAYLDVDLFARQRIEVEWQSSKHPVYPQQHGEFISHLSVLDLLLNCGDESAAILAGDMAREKA